MLITLYKYEDDNEILALFHSTLEFASWMQKDYNVIKSTISQIRSHKIDNIVKTPLGRAYLFADTQRELDSFTL